MFGKEVLFIYFLVSSCHGLFFHMAENEIKCFVQELPDNTPVIISYDLRLYDPKLGEFMSFAPGYQMHVETKDRMNRLIHSRLYEPKSDILFISYYEGDHRICLSPITPNFNWFSSRSARFRVYFDIKVGEKTINYFEVANREGFTDLELRIYQLLEQVDHIQKEYNYHCYREQMFRDTNSSTIRQIIKYLLLQSGLVLLIGLWRKKALKFKWAHLKRFFCEFTIVQTIKRYIDKIMQALDLFVTSLCYLPPC